MQDTGVGAGPKEAVDITIYVYTGKHLGGLFEIAEEKCIECNLNVTAAREVQATIGKDRVRVHVKSYFSNIHRAILKGIFHPPATLVNGRYVYGGEDIPNVEALTRKVLQELEA